ncbi:MAG: hypothetical protein HY925_04705 [Elusimicrobia bacterium]|nr:hypothetical protein [Elusimicrobiota bacterium]
MNSSPDEATPRFTVRLKDCPVCRHPWPKHDEKGACTEKDCWCLYHPPEEDVEQE